MLNINRARLMTMPLRPTKKLTSAPTLEKVVAALLTPVIESMRQAGIARLSIERDRSVVLQMDDGTVIGPIRAHAAFERIPTT